MSENGVDATSVVAVLLADGWHQIVPSSFSVGPLSFGAGPDRGVPGFRFEEAEPGRRTSQRCWPARWTASSRCVRSPARRAASATWTERGPRTLASGTRKAYGCEFARAAEMSTPSVALRPACDDYPDWRDEAACRVADRTHLLSCTRRI